MEDTGFHKTILSLSIPLTILIIIASYFGLFIPGTYSKETLDWIAQAIAQDFVDLFVVTPLFIISLVLFIKKNKAFIFIWGGAVLYFIYTFFIYCFDVHFNQMFIIYCWILGLSVYAFLYFLLTQSKENIMGWFKDEIPIRTTSFYLIILACLFYALWLSSIMPSIFINVTPKETTELNLPTNPIHVLDLSIFLPGIFAVAILLLRKKSLGFLLAPVFLTFLVLMDTALIAMVIVQYDNNLVGDLSLAYIMGILAFISFILLIRFLKSLKSSVN